MRIVICEDEELFAKALQAELGQYFLSRRIPVEILWYSNGNALKKMFEKTLEKEGAEGAADLLFMDIQLGDSDGVDVVRKIRENNAALPVIMLTSLEERVLDGYEIKAFHFLYKKDYKTRLASVLDRFLREVYDANKIMLQSQGTVQRVSIQDIYYVEAENRNTRVHTESLEISHNEAVLQFCRQLPEWLFVEVYHCLYVNVDHISRVDTESLLLDNGKTVPVSRRKRKEVLAAVMKRLEVK